MSDNDKFALLSILDAIDKIENYTKNKANHEDFNSDIQVFDATLMNFIMIGEMISKLSEEIKNNNSDIEWSKIKNFRNLIAHNYFGIDAEEIWQIIKNKLKPLKLELLNIIENDL